MNQAFVSILGSRYDYWGTYCLEIKAKSSAPPVVETSEKEELLKLVEQDEGAESLDEASLKRMILNFEKRVLKNQELRIKFPDSPEKYDFYPRFSSSFFFIVLFYFII